MSSSAWAWRSGETLVRATDGSPRLWMDVHHSLHDALGVVRLYESGAPPSEPEELAVFVAEWLACAAERDGPVRSADIHPTLRALVYQLAPATIDISDEDLASYVLS